MRARLLARELTIMQTTKAIPGLIVAVFLHCTCANGGFVRTWGGTGNTAPGTVAVDTSGCAYVVGGFGGTTDFNPGPATYNRSAGGYRDAFMSKFSTNGTWLWTQTWGSSNDDRANSVVIYGSNVYVAGCFQDTVAFNPAGGAVYTAPRNTNGFPDNNAYLCKYDVNGNFKWARAWGGNGGDEAYDVVVDGSGFVYVCGDFGSTNILLAPIGGTGCLTNHGRWDAFLFKFNSGGTSLWAKSWGGPYYDDCTCLAVTEAGTVYGGGMFASPTADFDPGPGTHYLHANNPGTDWGLVDVFLTKLDAGGNFLWARSWGCSNHWDAGQGVAVDSASNVYVAGYFADTVDFNPLGAASNITARGGDDTFLCKYDAAGTFKWVCTWGGASNDYARGLAVDGAGNVYVPGDFNSTNVDFDPGSGVDTHSSQGGTDITLSKFDANGRFIQARTCGGPQDDNGYGSVAVDAAGQVFETGSFASTVNFGQLVGGTSNQTAHGARDTYLCATRLGVGSATFTFRAIGLTNSAWLRWTDPQACGMASPNVQVRWATDHYPSNITDGTAAYTGTNLMYAHDGLTPGQAYYYTIWVSQDGTNYTDPP